MKEFIRGMFGKKHIDWETSEIKMRKNVDNHFSFRKAFLKDGTATKAGKILLLVAEGKPLQRYEILNKVDNNMYVNNESTNSHSNSFFCAMREDGLISYKRVGRKNYIIPGPNLEKYLNKYASFANYKIYNEKF